MLGGRDRGGDPAARLSLVHPSEAFPVTYRRGRAAHLDVGGPVGRRSAGRWRTSSAWWSRRSSRSGWPGSAGSTPLRIKVKGDPDTWLFGKLYARSHLRADRWYKLGRELLYGRLEDEKPFHTVRRLVQQEDYALHKLYLAGLPTPRPVRLRGAHPRAGVPARHRVLRPGAPSSARPRSTTRSSTTACDHPQAVGRRPGPPRHQAGQPAGPRRPPAADRRGLRPGPPEPLAPGRRPGQHDALPGAAFPIRELVYQRACASSPSRRSARRSPPPAGWPCPPSCGGCSATRAVTSTPSSCSCCRHGPGRSGSNAGAPAGSPCCC